MKKKPRISIVEGTSAMKPDATVEEIPDFRKLMEDLGAAFEAIPEEQRTFRMSEMKIALSKLSFEERDVFYSMIKTVLGYAARIKGVFHTGATDLFGAAADRMDMMNLLCAVNPKKLSMNVIDRLIDELDHLPSWTGMPPALVKVMAKRQGLLKQLEADDEREENAKAH